MRLAPKAIEIEAVVVADGPAVVAVVVAAEEAVAVDTVEVGASGVGKAAFTRFLLASCSGRCPCYFLVPSA